jgi:universal stress protein A
MDPIKLPRRILVPVDFSEGSRAAFDYALALAEKLDGEVELLHVWETPTYLTPELWVSTAKQPPMALADYARQAAEKDLDAWRGGNRHRVPVRSRVAVGVTDQVIVEIAAEFDLVVMGTHGRTGLSHLFVGSVAERVVRRAPCPVLTVRRTEKGKKS